jgi:hypothetical protein
MDNHDLQTAEIFYPESDGKPMADNTLQWDWMVKIVGELRELYAGQQVFVAGDLFWYPVEGDPRTVVAPDALVVFGRPPGYRGSYKQWQEESLAPQVVFEVLSPNNTKGELEDKLHFYDDHGVEEYYFIDPYEELVTGYIRRDGVLLEVEQMEGFTSPRLGCRFVMDGGLRMYLPNGREFLTREDRVREFETEQAAILAERDEATRRAEREAKKAEREAQRAQKEAQRADEATLKAERYRARLRELGIDPDQV